MSRSIARQHAARTLGFMLVSALVLGTACERATPTPGPPDPAPPPAPVSDADRESALAALEVWERAERARIDWRATPPGHTRRGPDPIDIVTLSADRFVVALRGTSELLLVDGRGAEISRVAGPAATRALRSVGGGGLLAVGELDAHVWVFRVTADRLVLEQRILVPGVSGMRGVDDGHGPGGGVIHVVDALAGEVVTLDWRGTRLGALPVGAGALAVHRASNRRLIATSVEGHRAVIATVDERGVPDPARVVVLENDGPVWGIGVGVVQNEVWIALGLVEDHALDRTHGSFQFIDSFVRVEALPLDDSADPAPRRVLLENVSALGVVVPKALSIASGRVMVAAAGSPALATIEPGRGTSVRAIAPGTAALVSFVDDDGDDALLLANPLLDALVRVDRDGEHVMPIASSSASLSASPVRTLDERIGEALVFTNLIAPAQKSDGGLSRFTCETCHFEGGVDGRIHSTGRGDVHATTKPLFGLGNNVPLFTRALDVSLTRMAHNELRVANAESGHPPWFTVSPRTTPWLAHLGVKDDVDPIAQRRALAAFFLSFTPEPNPRGLDHAKFSADERAGALLFSRRCERCHAARLIGADEKSAVPIDEWQALVLSPTGPIVWTRDGYEKTGVEPYVHADGARPSSLRRIARKIPYFTNGSARSLDEVLSRARFDDAGAFMHASERTDLRALTPEEARVLRAFLELL